MAAPTSSPLLLTWAGTVNHNLLPDVDSTLRLINQWPKSPRSTAVLPLPSFRYVYARFRDCPGRGYVPCPPRPITVAKITDDLYCCSNTPQELFCNLKVLQALHNCNLCLSAHKTIISSNATTILDWIWTAASLSASPHRLNTLATYPEPSIVGGLRSFIAAYKVLSHVLPPYLTPLNAVTTGRSSHASGNHKLD